MRVPRRVAPVDCALACTVHRPRYQEARKVQQQIMPANAKSNRPLVIAAVMASMAMTAFEATIVATAIPQIVAQLGGLAPL